MLMRFLFILSFLILSIIFTSLFFWSGKFQTEIGKSWAAEIISRRKSRLRNNPNWLSLNLTDAYLVEPICFEWKIMRGWPFSGAYNSTHHRHVFLDLKGAEYSYCSDATIRIYCWKLISEAVILRKFLSFASLSDQGPFCFLLKLAVVISAYPFSPWCFAKDGGFEMLQRDVSFCLHLTTLLGRLRWPWLGSL